jgi:hypothetical protein
VTDGDSRERAIVVFDSPHDVVDRLLANGYLADETVADAVFLADRLSKPVLVEGPARRSSPRQLLRRASAG